MGRGRKAFSKVKAAATAATMAATALSGSITEAVAPKPIVPLRQYQARVFWSDKKTVILHWSRQIGKSYTLAAWAVDRLLKNPGRLVTVLSNSRDNGAEFVQKCREVCGKLGQAIEEEDLSESLSYDDMRFEVKIEVDGKVGRIKVLAANPRTARGFSGDLILDEFAFHEDSRAIWEAAEPIISSNPDYLCRIASTGNGRLNMFYQLISEERMPYYRVRRSDAWGAGEIKIYSAVDGREITPDEARAEASDKRAYDQNYECTFEDENMPLLTQDLISAAQRDNGFAIDHQAWSLATLHRFHRCEGPLEAGWDIGRFEDLSVICVFERLGNLRRQVGELEMRDVRSGLQEQQARLLLQTRTFRRIEIDITGMGTKFFEDLEDEFGSAMVGGVNFASTEPVTTRIRTEGRKALTARVTEIMASDMLGCFEDKGIEIFNDPDLRDDLRKPEKVTSPGGRVSIAASRDKKGHADRFWGMALAIRAGYTHEEPGTFRVFNSLVNRIAEQAAGLWGGRSSDRQDRRHSRRCIG
ncbi:MAG TPA: terminase family protein [Chthoniobacter sp.]|nr:terminase family protein [Chthoniobacter sp.]